MADLQRQLEARLVEVNTHTAAGGQSSLQDPQTRSTRVLDPNTSDIQPEVHSTDTHGTNAVNFAILHLFGRIGVPKPLFSGRAAPA